MAAKALNLKIDEAKILDWKNVASVFDMTLTDLVKNACDEYVDQLKRDPFYRLTINVRDASDEESEEILSAVENLSDDDLAITTTKKFTV